MEAYEKIFRLQQVPIVLSGKADIRYLCNFSSLALLLFKSPIHIIETGKFQRIFIV